MRQEVCEVPKSPRYLVLAKIGHTIDYANVGLSWGLQAMTRDGVVSLLLSGEIEQPLLVEAFDIGEGWSADVSKTIAADLVDAASDPGTTISYAAIDFVSEHLGERHAVPLRRNYARAA